MIEFNHLSGNSLGRLEKGQKNTPGKSEVLEV